MKIFMGPPRRWIGPYQIADWITHLGFSEKTAEKFGRWLNTTCVKGLCQKIHERKKRKINIHIDEWDLWSMDTALAMIILPMLKKLKECKHSYPIVKDSDAPEHLSSKNAPPKEFEYDVDENAIKRWDWVLDEIIWSFEQLQPECDWNKQYITGKSDIRIEHEDVSNEETGTTVTYGKIVRGPNDTQVIDHDGIKAHEQRIARGLTLFGKYYQSMYD